MITESNYKKAMEIQEQIQKHEQLYTYHEEDEHELETLFHQLQDIAHLPLQPAVEESKQVKEGQYVDIPNKPQPFTYDPESGEVRPPIIDALEKFDIQRRYVANR